jgi:hypothetical protein
MGLTMAPVAETTTTTAAHQDQRLFVLGDDAIYSVSLESVVPSVRPVAPWTVSDFSALEFGNLRQQLPRPPQRLPHGRRP